MTGISSGMETVQLADDDSGFENAPFAQALVAEAADNPAIVGLSADLARYTDIQPFAERFPDRFVNVGMAEQNLIGVAAGLAHEGLIPVATTYAAFATRRALDLIEIQVALMERNVKIVAGLPGLTTGYGGTHQGIDDLAIMRAVPNMVVLDPADAVELREATTAMLRHEGPVYLRLQRGRVPRLSVQPAEPFRIGRARVLRTGDDIVIVAIGIMVQRALDAAGALSDAGIQARVIDAASLKPLDEETIAAAASSTGRVVTAENHSVVGGLFGAVAEVVARHGIRCTVTPVGIADRFGGYGSLPYLSRRFGIDTDAVTRAARAAMGDPS